MPSTTKTYANLNDALDALGNAGLAALIEEASDDISTAESVETLDDFKGNLAAASKALTKMQSKIEKMLARC